MDQQDFDNAVSAFSITMGHVANWKHSYGGSVYSTRLRQAINDARMACDRLEPILYADRGKAGEKVS